MEENISEIFSLLHQYKIKTSLIQNSAISFSVCVEDKFGNFNDLKAILSKKFKVAYNENVSETLLEILSNDKSELVRGVVSKHIKTPLNVLEKLLNDESDFVKREALLNIKNR